MDYQKSKKYLDVQKIYDNCSGPGGLELAELMAEKMKLEAGKKLIDIGFYRGYQTCFLAKDYEMNVIGIDPGGHFNGEFGIEQLMENARHLDVEERVMGIKVGVPDTLLPNESFDYAYTTTALEMLRNESGEEGYLNALREIHRLLKSGGILGLGEPMHHPRAMPEASKSVYLEYNFDKCFVTLEETKKWVEAAGFKIIEADYAKDAQRWWLEFAHYSDKKMIEPLNHDKGQWLSYGYVIAVKP
jgi:cyclopropane fatty-acyl-phospholipid synthase-like methyltransferase